VRPFEAFVMETLVIFAYYSYSEFPYLCVPLVMWSGLSDLVFLRGAVALEA
jgi:hypothetical protein